METNIVDVAKGQENWPRVCAQMPAIWGNDSGRVIEFIGQLELAISNEYLVHEAGHLLGISVDEKTRTGHFHVDGHAAWPLIFLEEARADLHSFGVASVALSPALAARVFLYNLSVRFGTHRDGLTTKGVAAYGLVPFLLFCVLREIGALEVREEIGRASFRLASYETGDLMNMMMCCGRHAEERLSIPEMEAPTPLDRALLGARYVRARLNEGECAADFPRVTGSAP